MKIYGQSFRDIFGNLPWPYKIVVLAGCVFIPFVIADVLFQVLKPGSKPVLAGPLQIARAHTGAIFDPALAVNPKSGDVWLAYTAAEPSSSPGGRTLFEVKLAKSDAGGCKNWSGTEGGFEAKGDDLLAPDGQTVFRSGAWRIETPSLVYDPDDPGKEWKLYAYKYFWPQDPASALQVAQHYGMIVYKYSSDPAGKSWSTEQWLFSAAPDYPPPPYESMVLLQLNRLDPSLQTMVTYSRPSVVYKEGALIMTLSAFTGGATPDRIIMLASKDHGNSWKYVGAPLKKEDLAGIGPYTKLAGATLIERQGRVYLAAVLGDEKQQGTFIFGFDDLSQGILQRDPKTGVPALLHQIPLQGKAAGALGGGFAAYTDQCSFGLLTSEQSSAAAGFQIFKTYVQPVAQ